MEDLKAAVACFLMLGNVTTGSIVLKFPAEMPLKNALKMALVSNIVHILVCIAHIGQIFFVLITGLVGTYHLIIH